MGRDDRFSRNVYVTSDATFTTLLTKYSPSGVQLGQITIGGLLTGALGKMAVDPAMNVIWDLTSSGELLFIDPVTLNGGDAGGIGAWPTDIEHVFDIASGTTRSFVGYVFPNGAQYGDIALLRRGNQLDVFVTGVNGNTSFPFVTRLRFHGTDLNTLSFDSARVILSSLFQPGPVADNDHPRGIAVSPNGTVLTSSHVPTSPGNSLEVLIAFSADFPETHTGLPRVVGGGRSIPSQGMTTDAAGNFYVSTRATGVLECGSGGSGAMLLIPAFNLNQFECGNLNRSGTSEDVAISPAGNIAYMTSSAFNAVVKFVVAPPTAPPAPANNNLNVAKDVQSLPMHNTVDIRSADVEPAEPQSVPCQGFTMPIGHTVWYSYTPATTTDVTIDTEGSTFNTVLAVYTGQSLGALTLVGCNDDGSPFARTSYVQFRAIAGTRYIIQVGGFQDDSGSLTVNVNGTQTPPTATPTATFTPTPTKTPAASPSATATPTSTPSGSLSCDPRPRVNVSVEKVTADRLQVTLSATGDQNALRLLRFGAATNALIDVGSWSGLTGNAEVGLATPVQTTTFVVRRPSTTIATTVSLVAIDDCGDWPTLVGAGTDVR